MNSDLASDTIAVHVTPPGRGAVSVWVIDGPDALEAARRLLQRPVSEHGVPRVNSLVDGETVLDEVLALVVSPDESPTGNPQVEVHCHGAPALDSAFALLVEKNASLREGISFRVSDTDELSRRRLIARKSDAVRLEAEALLRNAVAEKQAAFLARQAAGELSEEVNEIIEKLNSDIDEATGMLEALVSRGSDCIRGMRLPVVAVAGRPNVGKSSIMNRLLGEDRSVVSAVKGTTRDSVGGWISCGGINATILDTAGIRRDPGEKEALGISRAMESVKGADLSLLVFDGSEPLEADDFVLAGLVPRERRIDIINKIDLPGKIEYARLNENDITEYVRISAVTGEGFDELARILRERIGVIFPAVFDSPGVPAPFTERQMRFLQAALECLPDDSSGAKKNLEAVLFEM